jgi:hypothetical protein
VLLALQNMEETLMNPTRREWLTAMGALGTSAAVLGAGTTPVSAQEDGDGADDENGENGENGDGGQAALRVAHFSGDAPNVDVYLDGEAVLTDVPYGIVSDYLQVSPGDHTVEITAAGDAETVVFSGTVTVEPWTAYTAAAIGSLTEESFEVAVLEDSNLAQVRLLHAVPDAPAVDVTTGEDDELEALFDGVEFGEASEYVTVVADQYTLSVRGDTESNDGDVVAETDVFLAPGGVYTVVARGFLAEDAPEGAAFTVDLLPDVTTAGLDLAELLSSDGDDEGDDEAADEGDDEEDNGEDAENGEGEEGNGEESDDEEGDGEDGDSENGDQM